jgi:hypothetical protein
VASRRPWREAWTLRHDLNSVRAMPGIRTGLEDNQGRRTLPKNDDLNRGYFD